ncbi:MAG: AAA family ATPase, partial [Selenomonadales bacterium]|nr:AAA family ATPase [Selenomonadales bacterium]
MMDFFNKFLSRDPETEEVTFDQKDQLERQVAVLFNVLSTVVGAEQVILRAGKLGCLELIRSERLEDRILALQKLVFQDPTHDRIPDPADIPALLADIEEELADMMARKTVEDKIEKKVVERMEERHQEYVSEIRQQILKEEEKTAENPQTIKKLEKLEALEKKSLTRSLPELLRPQSLEEIIGQERAVDALKSKLASVYPQHLLLYGPPGVGKTTAARLVLQAARELKHTPFAEDAPFVEVDGTTLRWDPRDITNPLIGSVHDPIYQGARRDLAETGIPEPKPGLVTDAHGGILFIDEIGEMDPMLQNKLLKVMEDKRVSFDSTYYDTSDPSVPNYIRRLFEHGAPADFILIGATTRAPYEINPAFRSRCAEIFFESLTPSHIQDIIKSAMEKLHAQAEAKVAEIISEYTIEGRKAI